MRFVVTTCGIQLILHRVNAKIGPTLVKETRLSLYVGPSSCYYRSDHVNWPLLEWTHCESLKLIEKYFLKLRNMFSDKDDIRVLLSKQEK